MSRSISSIIYHLIFAILRIVALGFIGYAAYSVRMHAINIYGLVIHEFDPWFNFRATQYLADNGVEKFFHWFDYMSWSPLGRPVGTTIYPGMQLLSVYLWKLLNHLGLAISLNDVCCYVPVWGGITATMLIGATTYVSTGSANAAVFASAVMSVIPAHIMRSVGGGFDNESVAISALCLTFLFWTYSLSGKDNNKPSYIGGILTGLAYICMVASWGGYVFVCNVIALHAFVLVFFGRFSNKLYWAYTLWYIIGTTGAIQVPVVGLTPLKSLEQMAPLGVFFLMQALQFCELSFVLKAFGVKNPSKVTTLQRLKVRAVIFFFAGLAGAAVVYVLWPTGYFGPLSARIRGLFVQHTRTGNPLVDSVAEHQPASPEAFWQFLHYSCHSSPIGFGLVVLKGVILPLIRSQKRLDSTDRSTDPLLFIITYASVTYFFATKMNRLMLLMGPVSAMLSGVALGFMFDFVLNEIFELLSNFFSLFSSSSSSSSDKDEDKKETEQEKEKEETEVPEKKVYEESSSNNNKSNKSSSSTLKKRKTDKNSGKDANEVSSSSSAKDTTKEDKEEKPKEKKAKKGTSAASASATTMDWIEDKLFQFYSFSLIRLVRLALAGGMVYIVYLDAPEFYKYSTEMAGHLSHPSIMFQARLRDGTEIMVDDYREAYWWLRDNTPEDSRVMAWWDYGYQITGIGNRTTIADGNTWNHEHIALLGRALTSPEKRAHAITKHLADYVLLWTGGGGDDLAKSPHMARIANSVFDDVCPGDPTCGQFGFYNRQMDPTPMMAKSLLYKLHQNRIRPGVTVDKKLFQEVFMSKYGKVRIYQVIGVSQASKNWTNDPKNRECDAPGSWYCAGQYPPGLHKLLAKAKSFQQIEDFNRQKDEKSAKYHEEYMKKMNEVHG